MLSACSVPTPSVEQPPATAPCAQHVSTRLADRPDTEQHQLQRQRENKLCPLASLRPVHAAPAPEHEGRQEHGRRGIYAAAPGTPRGPSHSRKAAPVIEPAREKTHER